MTDFKAVFFILFFIFRYHINDVALSTVHNADGQLDGEVIAAYLLHLLAIKINVIAALRRLTLNILHICLPLTKMSERDNLFIYAAQN